MRKSVYWSLVCYPLAIVCMVAAVITLFLGKNSSGTVCGFALLALYMLVFQVIWAHFAQHKLKCFSEVIVLGGIATGCLCILRLILGGLSEVATNQLLMGASAAPVASYYLAQFWDSVTGRNKLEAESRE